MLRFELKRRKLETQPCNYVGIQWLIQTLSDKKKKLKNKIKSRKQSGYADRDIQSRSISLFICICVFFFFFLFKNFQRHYIQKDIPVSLFMCYPVDSKTSLVGNEQERSSSSQTQTFLRFLLKRKKRRTGRRRQTKNKWGTKEERVR